MSDFNWADFKPAPDQPVRALIGAIEHVESGGDDQAVSSQGATGAMQIMPATFQDYALPGESFDNAGHRRAAAIRKIVDDYRHFGGDMAKTAAAYIGGRGAVRADGTIRDDVADANGTTPVAYAQTVLGRVKAQPAVDWSQFKPAPQAGAGRGFTNPQPADPAAAEPRMEGATFQPETDQYGVPYQDTGGGRGFVNPPDAVQPKEVGMLESFGRGAGRAGAQTALVPSLLVSAAGVAWDKLHGLVSGREETGAQDAMFRNLVDPRQEAVDWYALGPEEHQGFLGKIADSLGAMAQDLPLMIASGGAKQRVELAQQFPTMARYLQNAFSAGFDAMRPIMVKAGTEKAKQVLDAGGTTAQAMNSATAAALWTGLTGAQPMSAEGTLLQRLATGIPVGMAQEEGGRVVQNAADPAALQRPFDAAEMVAGGATNAIAAGVLPHGGQGHAPVRDRIDLGYDPLTGKTPVAQAVAGMGERPQSFEPGRAEPARDPVADLFSAPTVEAAAQAAARMVDEPGNSGPSAADEIRSIRPSRPVEPAEGAVDERQPPDISPIPAGGDRGGSAEPGAGLDVPVGDDRAGGPAVDAAGDGGEAPAGAPHLGKPGDARAVADLPRPRLEAQDPIGAVRPGLEAEPVPFRRSDAQAGPGAKLSQIGDVVSTLTRDWLRKPDIHVLDSMDEAPEPVRRVFEQQNSQGAYGDVEGFHWRGGVYLMADALHSREDVQRVLFHEALGHFGLRGVFGDSLRPILDEVSGAMPDKVREKARQYGADYADPQQRRIAAEEVLAELAQTRPDLGIVRRAVAAIRTFLRAHGIDSLRMTQDEIIRNYILPARGWVERGKGTAPSSVSREQAMAARSDKPLRAPDAVIGNSLGAATDHPDYAAAKAGHEEAALRVARHLVTDEFVAKVKERLSGSKPLVLPVEAEEATGRNAIPSAAAEVLAQKLGLETATGIVQANRAHRTGMDGLQRIFAQADFHGDVEPGRDYLLLDDTITQGGTLAALASHIEDGGGRVVGVVALTGKQYSAKIEPSPETIRVLRQKHGNLEDQFRAATGHGFDALTESEARYLANWKPAEQLRDRIADEARRRAAQPDQGDAQQGLSDPELPHEFDPPQFSRREDRLGRREIEVGGQMRPIEDSTGSLVHPRKNGQKLFWNWFGDSKVVDGEGRPLLMFHGTNKNEGGDAFTMFDTYASNYGLMGAGGYFTAEPRIAAEYTRKGRGDTPTIYPVYLRIKHPLDMEAKADPQMWRKAFPDAESYHEGGDTNESWYRAAEDALRDEHVPMAEGAEAMQEGIRGMGFDGITHIGGGRVDKDGIKHRVYIAFDPEQVKSALGNRGTFEENDADIRFSRTGTTTATADMPPTAPTSRWERSKAILSDLLDEGLSRAGIYHFTAPMSEGSVRARAVAQTFANQERLARHEWQRISDLLQKRFTPEERRQMWEAADEQNTVLQQGQPTTGRGLDRLSPEQRDVVEQLHTYGEELLRRAKNVGMFQGEGLPYWTPRMMVMLDEHGEYVKPMEPGKKQTSGGDGRNVVTTSSNLKQRKYLTAAETEAAMQAKGGELVRDIMTMPLAMSRLERAIAGRELVNQIKELGRATGTPTVATGRPDHEGWFTLDHNAFTTFQPRFEQDPATGKMKPLTDEHGEMVFDRVPLYMSKEFEGPIKAILSNTDGTLYRAFMLLKSKAMSAIMFSPLIHNMVILGRAVAYSKLPIVQTLPLYFRGHAARQDNALMRTALEGGLVPMGYHSNGMIDVTDVARGFGREGGLLDPNESWIAHGAGFITKAAFGKVAGAKVKDFIDRAGDFWHGTLLWDRVADIQMGIFSHAYEQLQAKGFEPGVAKVMAAHWANRYAGAIARENMGEAARKAANVLLFSRSFNFGNLGAVKDLLFAMPSGLRAKIEAEYGRAAASQAFAVARRKAWAGFVRDYALYLIAGGVASAAIDRLKKDKGWDEIFGGYVDRAQRMADNIKQHPFNPGSYSPNRLLPSYDNEPGKQDRVDVGEIPDQGGRHEYMRLPTGKVVEDTFNWIMHPTDTFTAKMSPLAKSVGQVLVNDRGFGVPVFEPSEGFWKSAAHVAEHLAKAQTPWDTIVTVWDKLQGKTTPIENDKLVGNVTGFTFSQGHPQGPEAGVAAQVEDRIHAQRMLAMEEVKRLLKYDKEDEARQKLEDIGLAPREVNSIIKRIEQPKDGMSRSQQKKFNQHGTEEDQQRMDRLNR